MAWGVMLSTTLPVFPHFIWHEETDDEELYHEIDLIIESLVNDFFGSDDRKKSHTKDRDDNTGQGAPKTRGVHSDSS